MKPSERIKEIAEAYEEHNPSSTPTLYLASQFLAILDYLDEQDKGDVG